MNRKRIIKRGVLILIALLTIYVIYVAFDICLYANVDEKTNADAVIVLGAGVWNNSPSPVFLERINYGISLYKCGVVDKIIFTGGKSKNCEFSDAFIARKYAIANGIPIENIFIEELSTITQENIFYANQILKNNGMSDAIIVSDPLHMKRAMLMAKDNGLVAYSSPTPTTKYSTLKTKIPFLAREVFFFIGYKLFGRLTLISCKQSEVDGIIIGNTFSENQSFSENRELKKLICQTLNKDEKSLAKLSNFWCGGGAGCYDLGFVITQIIYRLGEREFIEIVEKLDRNEILRLDGLIRVGLEYGDNDKDGKMDNKKIENEFPNLNIILNKR